MSEKRETVGKIATDLAKNSVDNTHSAHEQMLECLTEWDKSLFACIDDYKKKCPGDFYIVVITKKERLLENVIRNYFMARLSCPTPDYDQTVYKVHRRDDSIEFMWTIPSKDTCLHIKQNVLAMDPEEQQLVKFVLDFADGTLFKLSKKLNNEMDDSILLKE
jgi:hypothetical protein